MNRAKLIQGAGVNDASYPVTINAVIGGRKKQLWMCPLYSVWRDMLERCYSAKCQAKNPTYIGCSVTPEWHSFSEFRAWMITQDWQGNQLDKDILIPGNKVYGASTCAFIPGQLNNFMVERGAARGAAPLGVYWREDRGKFKAQCRNPFTKKTDSLGHFDCQNEAHEAWRKRKHELACQYADMQTDTRIAEALRSRYAPSKQRPSSSVDANSKR